MPSAILRPKLSTVMVSQTFMTNPMSCSTSRIVNLKRSRMWRRSWASACVSAVFRPEAGSSRSSNCGPRAKARPSSRRFCRPRGRLPAACCWTCISRRNPMRSSACSRTVRSSRCTQGRARASATSPSACGCAWRPGCCREHSCCGRAVHFGRCGQCHAGNLIRAEVGDVAVPKTDSAARWVIEAANTIENGGLPGTIRADEPVDLAGVDAEAHAVNRAQAPEVERKLVDRQLAHGGPAVCIAVHPGRSSAADPPPVGPGGPRGASARSAPVLRLWSRRCDRGARECRRSSSKPPRLACLDGGRDRRSHRHPGSVDTGGGTICGCSQGRQGPRAT